MNEKSLSLIRNLSEAHGVSGFEQEVRNVLEDHLGPAYKIDRMGNIIFERPGRGDGPRVLLAAHMDEVGFAVQSITAEGHLRIIALGGWWTHSLPSQRVEVLTRRGEKVLGVIASKPPHFLQDSEKSKLRSIEDLFIDIGARDRMDACERFGVALGDPIVPVSPLVEMGDDFLMGKAFDDRAGVALGAQIFEWLADREFGGTAYFAATVQEEVGTRGVSAVCEEIDPDFALVLEGTPADDVPGIPAGERQGVPGNGVQIRLMDPSAIMQPRLVEFCIETARAHDVPHQLAVRRSGGTDARMIHNHRKGIPTVVLGVPVRYAHSHCSMMHKADYEAALSFLRAFFQQDLTAIF